MPSFIITDGKLLPTVLSVSDIMIIISRQRIVSMAFERAIGKTFFGRHVYITVNPHGLQEKMFTHLIQR